MFVKILNVARALQKIGGIKSLRLINQGKHILSLSIKHLGVISDNVLEYFCTTGCAFQWLRDNLSNIIERGHTPKKITEKIIRQSE
jgi:helix-turn-helix protein